MAAGVNDDKDSLDFFVSRKNITLIRSCLVTRNLHLPIFTTHTLILDAIINHYTTAMLFDRP